MCTPKLRPHNIVKVLFLSKNPNTVTVSYLCFRISAYPYQVASSFLLSVKKLCEFKLYLNEKGKIVFSSGAVIY